MKSMLVTALLVLLAVVLFAAGDSLSSEKPIRAEIPHEEGHRPHPADHDSFLARADDRDRERRPERPPHPPRDHHQLHERDRHREHPEEHRNFERELDQQRHRIQNMHVAAEHLDQAGLHDLAHRIHREANETEQNLRERLDRHRHPEHHPGPEVPELLEQLRNEVSDLKHEVRELRELVQKQAERPEK